VNEIQPKEKIELTARLAKSRRGQRLKFVADTGPVLPTADRTIPEQRSARARSAWRSIPGSARTQVSAALSPQNRVAG
jgi:hypothetical protein